MCLVIQHSHARPTTLAGYARGVGYVNPAPAEQQGYPPESYFSTTRVEYSTVKVYKYIHGYANT